MLPSPFKSNQISLFLAEWKYNRRANRLKGGRALSHTWLGVFCAGQTLLWSRMTYFTSASVILTVKGNLQYIYPWNIARVGKRKCTFCTTVNHDQLKIIPTGIRYDIPKSCNWIRPDLSFFFTTKSFDDVIQPASTLNGDGFKLYKHDRRSVYGFIWATTADLHTHCFHRGGRRLWIKNVRPLKRHGLTCKSL